MSDPIPVEEEDADAELEPEPADDDEGYEEIEQVPVDEGVPEDEGDAGAA